SPAEVPSHLLWIFPKGEYGPYSISFMAYQSWEQFIELLGVLRSLGDQVRLVEMVEPAPFNLQGLLDKPVRAQIVTKGGEFENITTAEAFQQVRILDLGQCISALSFPNTEPVSFTLELADPIGGFLEDRDGWRGLSGTYTLTLGPVCELIEGLRTGENGALPHMKAGIGALSRLLFGVLPASVLSAADKMEAPEELIERLDNLIRLPEPHFDWYF
ncbi:MAG: sterol carrier protein domain-containing protein, partial [Spirochaetia bacterium]